MKKTILTPIDYTELTNVVIAHAAEILKTSKGDLLLLHVIKNSDELSIAKKKMGDYKGYVQNQYPDITVKSLIRIGDFLEDIGKAALENNAEFIVMGTHGVKGMQLITGSRALKVIANSEVPVIVVQKEANIATSYKKILVPMTLAKNSKQKLSYAKHLALYFGSKIFLLAPSEKDEFLKNKIQRDLNFSKQYFKEAGLEFEVDSIEGIETLDSYIDFAVEKEIDLIVFMNQPESAYIIFDDRIQRVISNKAHIPVLLINPKTTSFVTIFGNYSGQG